MIPWTAWRSTLRWKGRRITNCSTRDAVLNRLPKSRKPVPFHADADSREWKPGKGLSVEKRRGAIGAVNIGIA